MLHHQNRKIPNTIATQHPDNAARPYWHDNAFVSTAHEVEECYRSFADLDCEEYMWDWEGKFVDEAVVDRLLEKYYAYFERNPLGRDFFLTFRIPNAEKEGQARMSRAFACILSAAYTARELKLPATPVFEVINPMTQSSEELINLQTKFHKTAAFQRGILEIPDLKPQYLDIIPLVEGTGTLLKSRKILEKYAHFLQKATGKKPGYLRPFIARSDPALDGGMVAAVLSAKAALSENFHFEREHKISVYPMIGVGSLPFRGGLHPDSVDEFIETYPGVATVTVQSAFRYDYPLEKVRAAIAKLNRELNPRNPKLYSQQQLEKIAELDEIFSAPYRQTIEALGKFINTMAKHVPPRRERLQHTGHFGYSRKMGKEGLVLPRAITFTAVFYSIGVPPELIGLGRGLREAHSRGLIKDLLRFYPQLLDVIRSVGCYFNRENLEILAQRFKPFQAVQTDLQFLEAFLGKTLEPKTPEELLHRNYTSNTIQNWRMQRAFQEDVLKAAQVRRSIG